jgi:nitrate/TMAO reductase-like tetraheme cytochrome c subunit
MKRVFPVSFYNPLAFAGAGVAGVSFGLILFLMVLESLSSAPKPYMGIIAFVILPVFLILGLAVMIVGIVRQGRRLRAGRAKEMRFPQIDLNNPHHRRAFTVFALGGLGLLLFSAFGSFKAYEYTDSDQFCGETCHKVMNPEYTAYQFSPHARVGCVKCHIGSGADWYVRSKISGAYQVYATLFNKYPRPIPTPIENLRPAQETCEQCHWPKHFYSEKQLVNTYFLSDESNTRWHLNLLVRIGGGNLEAGPTSGIHWHMNIANEVMYVAADTDRQVIPWVQVKGAGGAVKVYRSTESTLAEDQITPGAMRKLDCIDCHNRPTHIYHPPDRLINHMMSLGWIDARLPNIKSVAVTALEAPYGTQQGGLDSIGIAVREYYGTNMRAVADTMKGAIDSAVAEIGRIYARNYFPEMGVSWKKFPNNVGHMYYPGCFRCHDNKHVSEEGKVLTRDCNVCHLILAQEMGTAPVRVDLAGLQYQHPVDVGDAWKESSCSDCHGTSQ